MRREFKPLTVLEPMTTRECKEWAILAIAIQMETGKAIAVRCHKSAHALERQLLIVANAVTKREETKKTTKNMLLMTVNVTMTVDAMTMITSMTMIMMLIGGKPAHRVSNQALSSRMTRLMRTNTPVGKRKKTMLKTLLLINQLNEQLPKLIKN